VIAAFREGYEEVASWPESRPGQLELVMLGRNLMLLNFLLNTPTDEERSLASEYLDHMDKRIKRLADLY
jgi:hypothetical protein